MIDNDNITTNSGHGRNCRRDDTVVGDTNSGHSELPPRRHSRLRRLIEGSKTPQLAVTF